MLVRFLTARTFKAHCLTFPLRVFAEQLREVGITVKYHYEPSPRLVECDVLCVSQEVFIHKKSNRTPPDRYKFLGEFRKRVDTLIWFDTSDGTGKTTFSVMPYVDLYAKNQLLKDRELYTREFYNNEYYANYYYKRGIDDVPPKTDHRSPLQPEYLPKLALSWNLGLGDWFGFKSSSMLEHALKIFSPWPHYSIRPTSPGVPARKIDISFRGRINYKQAATTFHRLETVRHLMELSKESDFRIVYGGKLPYQQYRDEMRQSKIVCSPFGLGEINGGRDFESFMDGALLFKPDMSHLETWPNFFEPDITYVPFAWDFSDFKTQTDKTLADPKTCSEVAWNGQENYLKSISMAGGAALAHQFVKLIQTAIHNKAHTNLKLGD